MLKFVTILATAAVVSTPALAVAVWDVPEIDAGAGTAALAALGATVALIWERRRR